MTFETYKTLRDDNSGKAHIIFNGTFTDGQQLLDFMELIEDRHARKSTIITSQLPVKNWYDVLARNTTVADAVLDRLAKTAHRIELSGDSMRK